MGCVLHVLKLCPWRRCLHMFPCACLTTLSFIDILRIDRISQILRRIFPLTRRAVWRQIDRSRLRQNHWLRFRHGWTFTGSRFLTSHWHGALLSDRIRKKITEMAAREYGETHKIEQTRKIVPFVTRKTPSSQHVSKLVLMSTYLIWIFGSKLIEQPNKRNSVGSGNTSHFRASSLEKSSWWQLHCLQKCTTETRLKKNVCWWVRNPHLTIAQILAFRIPRLKALGLEYWMTDIFEPFHHLSDCSIPCPSSV